MPSIYYETPDGGVYQVDDVAQRMLVYLHLHGATAAHQMVETVGADSELRVLTRIEDQLGRNTAGLVDMETGGQATLRGEINEIEHNVVLSDSGREFIRKHRTEMAMPADIAELAKKVARLSISNEELEEFRTRLSNIEQRVSDLEDT